MRQMTVIGTLGADPEVRHSTSGTNVVVFTLATSHRNKDGSSVIDWTRCVAYNSLGAIIVEQAKKGDLVYVQGEYADKRWSDKEGTQKITPELTVTHFNFLKREDTFSFASNHGSDEQGVRP